MEAKGGHDPPSKSVKIILLGILAATRAYPNGEESEWGCAWEGNMLVEVRSKRKSLFS